MDCPHADPQCQCSDNASVIGSAYLPNGAVINGTFTMVKLLFHTDGTVTWKHLYEASAA